MKSINYKVPARTLYNVFLRSMMNLKTIYVLLGTIEWGSGVQTGFDTPFFEIDVHSNIDPLRNQYTTEFLDLTIAYHAHESRDTILWLNAVRGFLVGTD